MRQQAIARDLVLGQPDFISSTNVLYPVCDALNLTEKFSKQYGGEFLNKKQVCLMLKHRIFLSASKNSDALEIVSLSFNPQEAIEIANAVAFSATQNLSKSLKDTQMLIQKAVDAHRVYVWLSVIKLSFLIMLAEITGIILIKVAPQMPPLLRSSPKPLKEKFSKY